MGRVAGFAAAVLVHLAILLLGGLLFLEPPDQRKQEPEHEVDLITQADEKKEEPDETEVEPARSESGDTLQTEEPPPPDMSVLMDPPASAASATPALEALSLGALESALDGGAGGGDLTVGGSLVSGGRIGGTGTPGAVAGTSRENPLDEIFNVTQLDQGPRPILQTPPAYPVEMRTRKTEGVVHVLFVVGADGRVVSPKIERSTHTAFEGPALEAVRRWRFEPGLRGGQKVPCRMRVPIRFSVS